MILDVYGSSSDGNCSVLTDSKGKMLVVDAGVDYKEVLKGINYNISDVEGVLITHEHSDHAKYIDKWIENGIKVYMPSSVKTKFPQYNAISVIERRWMDIGDFKILGFPVPHDETYCLGYLIYAENHRMLWLTDLSYCPFSFKSRNLTDIYVEANYDKNLANKDGAKWKHVLTGHCEIETTIGIIKFNKTDSLCNTFLAHLSELNSNPSDFIERVKTNAQIEPQIAKKGLSVDLG